MAANYTDLEKRSRNTADQVWVDLPLKPAEYPAPVLSLLFLSYANYRFEMVTKELLGVRKWEKLGLDWGRRQDPRALVRVCIEEQLDRLPPAAI